MRFVCQWTGVQKLVGYVTHLVDVKLRLVGQGAAFNAPSLGVCTFALTHHLHRCLHCLQLRQGPLAVATSNSMDGNHRLRRKRFILHYCPSLLQRMTSSPLLLEVHTILAPKSCIELQMSKGRVLETGLGTRS